MPAVCVERRQLEGKLMIRTRTLGWMLLGLAAVASPACAQETPDATVKRVAEDILTTVRADKELQAGNQAKIKHIRKEISSSHLRGMAITNKAIVADIKVVTHLRLLNNP